MNERRETQEIERITLGEGYLSWNHFEKSTARYGSVNLMLNPNNDLEAANYATYESAPIEKYGVLFAEVLDTAQSPFETELIKEEIAKVGDFIVLGEGYLFKNIYADVENIGTMPDSDSNENWMNLRSLKRLNNQKVRLYFEDPMRTSGSLSFDLLIPEEE